MQQTSFERPLPPLPPENLRRLVCHDDRLFELNSSLPVVEGVPGVLHRSVLDFGCGCGRIARQLLVHDFRPSAYVGIDINREMVEWCQQNLAPLAQGWKFVHHDVYNKNLGPQNSPVRTQGFPVDGGSISLVIAHSVFTHLCLDQTIFYLHEIKRVLQVDGVAKTTWFLFSRQNFPMLAPQQVCLFVNEDDPTNAVIYDWLWLRQAIQDAGLRVRRITPPWVPGHQWEIILEHRHDDKPDEAPSIEELRRGLCACPPELDLNEPDALPAAQRVDAVAPTPAVHSLVPPLRARVAPRSFGTLKFTGRASEDEFNVAVNQLPWWYHSYYFDNGFCIRGDYDIGADVESYGFPADLTGWNVLDVGSGAGWFSHYFAQRGAHVVAVDARGYEDFDVYGRPGYLPVTRPHDMLDDRRKPVYFSPVNQAFWVIRQLLQSNVEFLNGRVYELPQLFPDRKFDLVFMGALLCHLRDPIGALASARQVCGGMVIASTPVVIGEPEEEAEPRQYLPYTKEDAISWWLPNEACFRHWFQAAGFSSADPGPEVLLRSDKPRYSPDGKRYNGDQKLRVGRGLV